MKVLLFFALIFCAMSAQDASNQNIQEDETIVGAVKYYDCQKDCSVKNWCRNYSCCKGADWFKVPANANQHDVRTFIKKNERLFNMSKKTYRMVIQKLPLSGAWSVHLLKYLRKIKK